MRFLLDFIVIRSFEFLNQPVKKKKWLPNTINYNKGF